MIATMKKALIVCMKEDKDKLLKALKKTGLFMVIDSSDKIKADDSSKESQETDNIIKKMSIFSSKNAFFEERKLVNSDEILSENKEFLQIRESCANQLDKIKNNKETIKQNEELIKKLFPWRNLDVNLEDIKEDIYTNSIIGCVKKKNLKALERQVADSGASFQLVNICGNMCYLLVSYFKLDQSKILDMLKKYEFTENRPDVEFGKVSNKIKELESNINNLQNEIKLNEENLYELSKKLDKLKLLFEQEKAKEELNKISLYSTDTAICIEGWLKKSDEKRIESIVRKNIKFCDIEFFDAEENDDVPTAVENNKFVSQFEVITDMFSTPSYGRADPNPVMAPWYWIIFGLMVGDAGYGFVMLILCLIISKLIKPRSNAKKLINTITLSSFTTMFWGIMFGSYFGETFMPILFSPLDEPIKMLIFSMVLGVLHIFSGMLIKVYEKIKTGNFFSAVFDEISWICLITGLALLFLPQTKQIALYLTVVSVIVIFLTAGRSKKNVFGKLATGLTSLYGITSYISDILSYSRILALSLATGVVAMVMNMLAQMMSTSVLGVVLSLFVYVIGHTFNLALGLLSAYVHDSRLQYIEFFNKFYEGGGKEFRPLSIKTRYVDVKKD